MKHTVLIVGRSELHLHGLETMLQGDPRLEVKTRFVVNGHMDPLHSVQTTPNVLILDLSQFWEEELKALIARPMHERVQLLIIGPEGNTQMIRMAMQAGARDFFAHPVPRAELLASVHRIVEESTAQTSGKEARLTAVINAKGGSGASFVACNLAHCMAAQQKLRVALIDLDLQFGTLPLYLDLTPRDSLLDALAHADQIDSMALDGHMLKHKSGLRLLPSMSEALALPWEVPEQSLHQVLTQALRDHDHVVVDMPRQIDPLTSRVMERADHVLVVTQQSITHVRDAKRMVKLITRELALPADRIRIVVNRYDKKNAVSLDDITASTKPGAVYLVPNDYANVSEAINIGVPLYESARTAAITKSFVEIAKRLAGAEEAPSKGRFQNLFAQILAR